MTKRPMRYVSLHNHSTFSTGDGFSQPSEHVRRVDELGMKALSLTEHGNVSSWVALEKECEKAGIEPIFGIEIYYGKPKTQSKTHMILLAMNQEGLKNINRIVTKSYQQFYYSATVYWEDLVRWNEGIIALSGCADSALSCTLLGGKYFSEKRLEYSERDLQSAIKGVRAFQKIFGDRYYLEVQRFPGLDRTCVLNPALAQISRETGAKLVATSDVHYPMPNQNAIQRILHAADRGKDVQTTDASWEYDILLTYPQSDREILNDLQGTGLSESEAKEAVLATEEIYLRCKGTRLEKAPPPRFGVADPEKVLQEWISIGWKYRLKHNKHMREHLPEYKKRMKHEYKTICATKGFADYFLIVADLIIWAKSQNIAVGPGRGSSAGSLVCYLLQITEIDSMQFPMLFERFLDESRTDPPDIDIDFEDDRRDEVFEYAAKKYGEPYVANVGTFTRYLGKNTIDDLARVYHVPKWVATSIKSKLIEREAGHPRFSKSLEDTFDTFPDVRELVEQHNELMYGLQIEGNLKSFGIHAAAMVISSVPLNETCAIYQREIGEEKRIGRAIPYDKRDVAYLNLLKIDALSLITMGEIAGICREAGVKLEDLYRVPLDDEPTLEAFRKGDILGIFQFEGVTTRRILKKVSPTHFMHLADVNALSRPGANDKGYISNKNSGKMPEFAHDIIRQHTTEWPNTYGVLVYEEQILMILRDLGGFAPAELNRMRKIIHDKLGSSVFNENFERFIKGAAVRGVDEDTAKSIWDGMVSASGYAFNIAHSVSYGHIGYWQQYLKIHYPAFFYRAKLNKCADTVRRGKFIQEAERHGITVTPPDLLTSGQEWTINGNVISAGLRSIEGIGPVTAQSIIEYRDTVIKGFTTKMTFEQFKKKEMLTWDDLIEVKGIGKKTIDKIKGFVNSDDPFGVQKLSRTLSDIRKRIANEEFIGVPTPNTISIDIPAEKTFVSYIGIVREKKYYDAVQQLQKRSTEDLSYDDALAKLDDNHLLKYVALDVEDEYGEIIKVRISRWAFPKYAKKVGAIKVNRDVVVVDGYSSDFGGLSIQTKNFVVINPERTDEDGE